MKWQFEKGKRLVRREGGMKFRERIVLHCSRKQNVRRNSLQGFGKLIASAKSRRTRGSSHQPVFMGSCQAISHTCLPCLPSGRIGPTCVHVKDEKLDFFKYKPSLRSC